LLSIVGLVIQFILFIIGLPFATYTLESWFKFSIRATGYFLTLASGLALAIGALCLGLAPTIALVITGKVKKKSFVQEISNLSA
jgi:hypothetical protein